jgi:hypothetical protein
LTLSKPAPVVYTNLLKLFVRSPINVVFENDFNGNKWSGWSAVPGVTGTLAEPSALVHSGILKLFVTGLETRLWKTILGLAIGRAGLQFQIL